MISFKKIKRWIKIAALIYIAVGISLYFLQEKIIFHPTRLPSTHSFQFDQAFRELSIPVNSEKILSIVQFTVPDSVCRGAVLYFHGNRRNIERYATHASHFTRNNYEVWMIDYPGFGKSTGDRSEQVMYDDALRFYKLARSRFSADSIVLYGKSLGSGIASQLASVRDCKRLILETPYYSMDALMAHFAFLFPVKLMSKFHFPTNQYLENVDAPVHLIHGTRDGIIPFGQSKKLKKHFPAAQLIAIDRGKHNDLHTFREFHTKLDSLLRLP